MDNFKKKVMKYLSDIKLEFNQSKKYNKSLDLKDEPPSFRKTEILL